MLRNEFQDPLVRASAYRPCLNGNFQTAVRKGRNALFLRAGFNPYSHFHHVTVTRSGTMNLPKR